MEIAGLEPAGFACKAKILPLNYIPVNVYITGKRGLEPLKMVLKTTVLPIRLLTLKYLLTITGMTGFEPAMVSSTN